MYGSKFTVQKLPTSIFARLVTSRIFSSKINIFFNLCTKRFSENHSPCSCDHFHTKCMVVGGRLRRRNPKNIRKNAIYFSYFFGIKSESSQTSTTDVQLYPWVWLELVLPGRILRRSISRLWSSGFCLLHKNWMNEISWI